VADKKPLIVIKKITVAAAGHHGGSWKVAFADFMTAMMAFFLVMWLLAQSDQTKKSVAEYFSTPSVIEYNFTAYGAELTLEKMFLDLVNEPLKALQDFMQPEDYTPNIMDVGSKNMVLAMVADSLGEFGSNVEVNSDELVFEIPEKYLFKDGTAEPGGQFATIMDRVKTLTAGLEDSVVYIDSVVYDSAMKDHRVESARRVSDQRLDLVTKRVQSTLEHASAEVFGRATGEKAIRDADGKPVAGLVRFRVKQKELKSDGSKPRKLQELFTGKKDNVDVYNSFVKQVTEGRKKVTE
jgi:chemotaxis protein MotB